MATRTERIVELVEVARTYMDDGAWYTAADRLRAAADLLEEGQNEVNVELAGSARA